MKSYQFGVIGAGNMGLAITQGAVRAGLFAPENVLLFNRDAQKRAQNAALGFSVTGDLTEVYRSCDVVVLGIKPQNFASVLPALASCAPAHKPLVISIAAGITFSKIEAALGADTPIVRVMPNTPLLIGEGACALAKNSAATEAQLAQTVRLFATMGTTVTFENENMLNEVIPYNGSAPAYIYAFADAMAKSAAQHGLNERQALALFCQTMIGSAKMLLEGAKTPQELIAAVCSPGGTTIEAMNVLQSGGLAQLLADASDRCIARAYELGAD